MVAIREAYALKNETPLVSGKYSLICVNLEHFFRDWKSSLQSNPRIFHGDVLMILIMIIVVTVDFCGIGFCDFFLCFSFGEMTHSLPLV